VRVYEEEREKRNERNSDPLHPKKQPTGKKKGGDPKKERGLQRDILSVPSPTGPRDLKKSIEGGVTQGKTTCKKPLAEPRPHLSKRLAKVSEKKKRVQNTKCLVKKGVKKPIILVIGGKGRVPNRGKSEKKLNGNELKGH